MTPETPETTPDPNFWKKCNSCKKPIGYSAIYRVCNVSTCNRKRLGLSFCTVSCWDAHLPFANHRESWAEERKAPTFDEWKKTLEGGDKVTRTRKPKDTQPPAPTPPPSHSAPKVILRKRSDA